jgi:hypothetical protein
VQFEGENRADAFRHIFSLPDATAIHDLLGALYYCPNHCLEALEYARIVISVFSFLTLCTSMFVSLFHSAPRSEETVLLQSLCVAIKNNFLLDMLDPSS